MIKIKDIIAGMNKRIKINLFITVVRIELVIINILTFIMNMKRIIVGKGKCN